MNAEELENTMEALGRMLQLKKQKEAEFELQTKELNDTIEELKNKLRPIFLKTQESAQSEWLVVSYRKGAVRWDSAGLKAYAKTHPELKVYQKVGEPTIAFSLPKKEDDALVTMEERDGKEA